MLEVIVGSVKSFIWNRLPSIILRRFLNTESLKDQIDMDLRGELPIELNMSQDTPALRLWLKCTNRTPLKITIDRIIFEINVGNASVDGQILHRIFLEPSKFKDNIMFKTILSNAQKEAILNQTNSNDILNGTVRIEINMEIDCNYGCIQLREHKELRSVRIEGLPKTTKEFK